MTQRFVTEPTAGSERVQRLVGAADVRQAEAHQQDDGDTVSHAAGRHDPPGGPDFGIGLLEQQSHDAGRNQRKHRHWRNHQYRRPYLLQANRLQH